MNSEAPRPPQGSPWRTLPGDAGIFVAAAAAVAWAVATHGVGGLDAFTAAGFLVFGLLAIFCGFPHPYYGYISFDRVAQFAAVLTLGPVAAAAINMLASLLYPWHRLWTGHTLPQVVCAALANAGMMGLNLLLSGGVYVALGGPLPLTTLDAATVLPLAAMALTAHLLNDAFMAFFVWLEGGSPRLLFNRFSAAVEGFSFFIAILTAIAFQRLDAADLALYLIVLGVGMLAVRQLALLRLSLEQQVAERTRELEARSDELDRLVRTDALTGVFSRRHMDERLAAELQRAQRYRRPLAVALVDIDRFKQINDRHSHGAGDAVLRRVARRLAAGCRDTDVVGRYGGEEFVLCFPETAPGDAAQLCETLRAAVAAADWTDIAPDLAVTASFGVAAADDATPDAAALLAAADRRLYRAKHEGRDRVIAAG